MHIVKVEDNFIPCPNGAPCGSCRCDANIFGTEAVTPDKDKNKIERNDDDC